MIAVIFEFTPAEGRFAAVREWRNVQKHREAQKKGRAGIFSAYRLRICQVLRDYAKDSRKEAPEDSIAVHG